MAKIAEKVITKDGVDFKFSDGETVSVKLTDFPADTRERLMKHGLSQKGGDSWVNAESVGEARAMLLQVLGNLKKGIWASRAARGGIVVEALARVANVPIEEALTRWAEKTEAEKKAYRAHPQVQKAIAEIMAERAAAKVKEAEDIAPLDF